jgi:hypothetical protein
MSESQLTVLLYQCLRAFQLLLLSFEQASLNVLFLDSLCLTRFGLSNLCLTRCQYLVGALHGTLFEWDAFLAWYGFIVNYKRAAVGAFRMPLG